MGVLKEIMDFKVFNVGDILVIFSKRIFSKINFFKENNNSVLNRFFGSLNFLFFEKIVENKIDIEFIVKKVEL